MKREVALTVLLAALLGTVAIVNPAFLGVDNLRDIAVQVAPFAVLACGMAFVIVLGEIDISVGSMVGLLAVVFGLVASPTGLGSFGLALVSVLVAGPLLGLINGLATTRARVPSIIVTLGTLTVFRGVSELLLRGEWITDAPSSFIGDGTVIAIAAAIALVAWIVATRTPLGLRVYAAGGNPEAARVRGLDVRRLRLLAFAVLGLCASLATILAMPGMSVIEGGIGVGWELFVVTCVIVGGVSISGGKGSLTGVLVGVLLLGTVRTALLFLKLGDDAVYWERAIQGAFILAAILVDRLRVRRR